MRLSLLAFAGLALIAIVSLAGGTAPDDVAEDDELRTLMKERYEASAGEMAARMEVYRAGRESLPDTCDAIQRFSAAGIEVARTPAYRVKVCERAFDEAKAIEDSVKTKLESNAESTQAMKLATYTRLDMQIKLHKARRAEAAHKTRDKLDDRDLPPLLPPVGETET
jgi:hypothetical protein